MVKRKLSSPINCTKTIHQMDAERAWKEADIASIALDNERKRLKLLDKELKASKFVLRQVRSCPILPGSFLQMDSDRRKRKALPNEIGTVEPALPSMIALPPKLPTYILSKPLADGKLVKTPPPGLPESMKRDPPKAPSDPYPMYRGTFSSRPLVNGCLAPLASSVYRIQATSRTQTTTYSHWVKFRDSEERTQVLTHLRAGEVVSLAERLVYNIKTHTLVGIPVVFTNISNAKELHSNMGEEVIVLPLNDTSAVNLLLAKQDKNIPIYPGKIEPFVYDGLKYDGKNLMISSAKICNGCYVHLAITVPSVGCCYCTTNANKDMYLCHGCEGLTDQHVVFRESMCPIKYNRGEHVCYTCSRLGGKHHWKRVFGAMLDSSR
jgi:hypothetical protein